MFYFIWIKMNYAHSTFQLIARQNHLHLQLKTKFYQNNYTILHLTILMTWFNNQNNNNKSFLWTILVINKDWMNELYSKTHLHTYSFMLEMIWWYRWCNYGGYIWFWVWMKYRFIGKRQGLVSSLCLWMCRNEYNLL